MIISINIYCNVLKFQNAVDVHHASRMIMKISDGAGVFDCDKRFDAP